MLEMCALLRAAVLIVALFSVEAFAPPCDRVRSGGIKASSTCLSAMANPLKRRSKKKTNVLRVESIEEYKEKVVDEKVSSSTRSLEKLYYLVVARYMQWPHRALHIINSYDRSVSR